jgi:acyl-CoA thioesterase
MSNARPTRFERDTAVTPTDADCFEARIDRGWWVAQGPNGGYVAAILLRALELAVDDAERSPRSFTLHFVARPAEGPVRVETRVERRGRSLTTVTGRMLQDDRVLCVAVAAFSRPREAFDFCHTQMPEVAMPEECEPLPPRIEIHQRYDYRWAVGAPPFSKSSQALCGGWIRTREPGIADSALVAAYTDAFPPAIFSLVDPETIQRGIPTIDLTIHFRQRLPLASASPEDFALAVFRSRLAGDGFMEEDGEIWSRDGVLLAQSRQLALVT